MKQVTWDQLSQERRDEINSGCLALSGMTIEMLDAQMRLMNPNYVNDELYDVENSHKVWLRETRARVLAKPFWSRWMYWCPTEEECR